MAWNRRIWSHCYKVLDSIEKKALTRRAKSWTISRLLACTAFALRSGTRPGCAGDALPEPGHDSSLAALADAEAPLVPLTPVGHRVGLGTGGNTGGRTTSRPFLLKTLEVRIAFHRCWLAAKTHKVKVGYSLTYVAHATMMTWWRHVS